MTELNKLPIQPLQLQLTLTWKTTSYPNDTNGDISSSAIVSSIWSD